MLFQFCLAGNYIKKKNTIKFSKIGSDIGLLFQIVDDLIDHKGNAKKVGKKQKKIRKKERPL